MDNQVQSILWIINYNGYGIRKQVKCNTRNDIYFHAQLYHMGDGTDFRKECCDSSEKSIKAKYKQEIFYIINSHIDFYLLSLKMIFISNF